MRNIIRIDDYLWGEFGNLFAVHVTLQWTGRLKLQGISAEGNSTISVLSVRENALFSRMIQIGHRPNVRSLGELPVQNLRVSKQECSVERETQSPIQCLGGCYYSLALCRYRSFGI
jgi:hypothetical protein